MHLINFNNIPKSKKTVPGNTLSDDSVTFSFSDRDAVIKIKRTTIFKKSIFNRQVKFTRMVQKLK